MASESDFSNENSDSYDSYEVEHDTAVEDLDKLISLAEDVSSNLYEMYLKASEIKQKSLWFMGLVYILWGLAGSVVAAINFNSLGKIYEVLIIGGVVFSAIPVSILLISMKRNLRRLQNDIKIEVSVLHELLDMVHELENAGRYRTKIDPVSSATFRMRLKRLHFAID